MGPWSVYHSAQPSGQTLRLALVLLIATVVAASVVLMAVWANGPAAPAIPTWPPFTMVYETDGVVYSIGSSPSVTTREVRRLEYQSRTQWTDTVIEAPTITTTVGSSSRVGAYTRVNGDSYTEYNSSGELTYAETVGENTTILTGSMPPPFPMEESGVDTEPTVTSARVCFNDACTENAAGLLRRKANGAEFVYVDDARGIPLRVNDAFVVAFVVKEVRIQDAKQRIAR